MTLILTVTYLAKVQGTYISLCVMYKIHIKTSMGEDLDLDFDLTNLDYFLHSSASRARQCVLA